VAAPAANMRSLDRAFDVLSVLQSAKKPLRLSEIGRLASLHVATTQRILGVLLDRGYAARTGDGYTAGPATLAAAHAFVVTNPLSVLSQSTLQQLAVSTGLTASMYVRVENSRVLIARVESDKPLNYVLPVGERLPLYLGGAGKTILADMTGDEIDHVLADAGQLTLANGQPLQRAELDAQLDKIRRDGYAISISERLYGIASVTAPVRVADDTLVGVLGVTGDAANDFTKTQIAQLIPEVRRAATALGQRLAAA
jgi:IclR family acetate operon transcriptional repressor